MIANYHTHTWRCNHAAGTEEEYVRAALDRRLEILGFSDHSPYCFPEGYSSGFRMALEQLDDYCDTIRDLQKTYAGQIQIPLGVELEYYPAYFSHLLPILRDAGLDYFLLGQHFVDNELGAHYSGHPTADVEILKKYVAQSRDAMQTGLFTYFAHPDLIHFVGSERDYRDQMRRLCREAKSCGIPLECNMLGKLTDRHYPNPMFWELAAEEGCDVVLGCDAHAPDHLRKTQTEEVLLEMIRYYGLHLMDSIPLRPIK